MGLSLVSNISLLSGKESVIHELSKTFEFQQLLKLEDSFPLKIILMSQIA